MTVTEASRTLRSLLSPEFGGGEARAMERIIFEEVVCMSTVDVIVNGERELPDFIINKIEHITQRLLNGEPLQYILGTARFCGMKFEVTPAVLIPRPETEELVDLIVDRYGSHTDLRILDLGTGSGCIAVALARALKFPQITAVDISQDALNVARRNAASAGVGINFVHADMLNLSLAGKWDIIVSNPPYIMAKERREMETHVADHEPESALFVPDDDPMRFYNAVLAYARNTNAGAVYFEINPLCASQFKGAEIVRDAYGKQRFAIYDPF